VNIGTTVKGAVDKIGSIVEPIEKVNISPDNIHLHCDSALFGAMLNYVISNEADKLSFTNPCVN
jgi:glutamate/tyrosine decarboxylase-like PLP-dependent enzyme